MGTAERRNEILKTLCRRRFETIRNLASEFGVSMRTIQRDIEILSVSNPIYTKSGRYAGGIYVLDTFFMDRMYMSDSEIDVMQKVSLLLNKKSLDLSEMDINIFNNIISLYKRPKIRKEN